MTVFLSYNSQIKPGRRLDAIALAGGAAKLVERHGGSHPRLLLTGVAGELIDSGAFVIEFDSLAAYGAFADDIATDAEMMELQERASGANSPVTAQAQLLAADLPGRPAPSDRGAVSEVYIMRVRPGGLDAFLESTHRWCDLVEANGAIGARALRIVHGGSQTDLYVSVAEYASHHAWGQATDAWTNTEIGQQLAADLAAGTIPAEIVSSALYTEVPI
jgi:hypothetical protein